MSKIKRIICYIRAIPFWVRMKFNPDCFCPHFYGEDEEFATAVFLNRKTQKVRIADSFTHDIDEEYIPNAVFIGRTCKRCGYKTADVKRLSEWIDDANERELSIIYYERKRKDDAKY